MSTASVQQNKRSLLYRVTILSLTMLLLGTFWLSVRETSNPLSVVVKPSVTREGEPVIVTFKLNNASPQALITSYEFYANGELLAEGDTALLPSSSETHQYAYENPLPLGEQLNFMVRTQSQLGNYEKVVSLPSYPPQIWSSFVSFASFSTSLMGFMSTMTYYQSTFGSEVGFNLGLLFSIVLIALLIFLELTHPAIKEKNILILGRMRFRFGTLTWILLTIFLAIVYTKIVMIISG